MAKRTRTQITKPASLAQSRRKSRERREARTNPAPLANPPLWRDVTTVIVPGFSGYAATRVIARIPFAIVAKRWPRLAPHVYAASGLLTTLAAALVVPRIEKVAPYYDSIVLGSGIASIQGVADTYLPKQFSWLLKSPQLSDYTADSTRMLASQASTSSSAASSGPRRVPAAASRRTIDDEINDEYRSFDAKIDRLVKSSTNAGGGAPPPASASSSSNEEEGYQLDPDIAAELNEEECDDDEMGMGIFQRN